jgi:hypothetical protein
MASERGLRTVLLGFPRQVLELKPRNHLMIITFEILCTLGSRSYLDAQIDHQIYYAEFSISVTSKYRHMYGLLNIDEIKN